MTADDPLTHTVKALHDIARTLESGDRSGGRISRTLEILRESIVSCDRCAFLESSANGHADLIVSPEASADQRVRLQRKLSNLFRLITEDEEPTSGDSELQDPESERAHLALPVIGVDQTIGVLFIERDSDEPFGEESLRLLSLVAAQLAGYVVTLRALEREARTSHPDRTIRLAQLFSNLLSNALTHIPEGTEVHVKLARQGSAAIVSFHNVGPAIPESMLGWGRDIVNQIRALGGTASVESTAERTTFTVEVSLLS